ncbi:TPA: phage baseplate assembly protein V [Pasteurella multocida]|uniref:phage baseplate assembly protein V n=1 Tax=Pasteurella multocida TaxID=747 RepID=UPI00292CB727|nr:phage baseplate assembly protein V [Pasteurella multocida]WNY74388.1 phage baseplate assembly protein V [Pasteurella multocida]HDR1500319.1 phage baseplate assembly protein V [Pasteurella multocida]HDR1507934.1 phage baseplate assembly protein V [Pasteurella multocida]
MQTHNFTATYQEGIISDVDSTKHKVRCKIPALDDLETAWLSYLTPNAGGNQFYCLPDVGELVAIILDARGEGGCVLGAVFNTQDPTPTQDNNMWMKKFKNGTVISHNRKTGDVVVSTSGQVTVTAATAIVNAESTINGNTTINGDVAVNGEISATGAVSSSTSVDAPSVTSNGVSLDSHTHNNGPQPDK